MKTSCKNGLHSENRGSHKPHYGYKRRIKTEALRLPTKRNSRIMKLLTILRNINGKEEEIILSKTNTQERGGHNVTARLGLY